MMKLSPKYVLLVAALVSLIGCATGGPKYADLNPTIPSKPDTGRIFVYRTALLGAAVQPAVRVNGEAVGNAVPNGFFFIDRAPGDYVISTSTEVDRNLSLTLDKGDTRFVRLNISMGFFVGHVYPELIEPATGEKEIQDCHYTGSK